jgi:kynurenine 3-monooxygenase
MEKVTIVGAGLVGSMQALALAKRGCEVHVFERRDDIRKANLYQGRSINLALSNRGWKALEAVGLSEDVKRIAIPMYKRTMHPIQGDLYSQPYGREGEAIFSVSRGHLNKLMLTKASEHPAVHFHFNHRCLDVNLEENRITFLNESNGANLDVNYEVLLGTDGAFSAVRHKLMFRDRFDYQQFYIPHGYKELNLNPRPDGSHALEKECLHIWPRKEYMLIALPNLDGSFTCTLFFPFEGEPSFASLSNDEAIQEFFSETFPDFFTLMPDLLDQYHQNPSSSLVTVKCAPWNFEDKVLLMGDAAHAIVPFYGQGMNAGFEDVRLFMEIVDAANGNIRSCIEAFANSRKPDGDAIADLALHNFIEMRDKTADPEFLLQKKIEGRFFERHPDKWMPLYSMVTFSHIPYSQAWSRGMQQDELMKRILAMPDIAKNWDSEEVEQEMLRLAASL